MEAGRVKPSSVPAVLRPARDALTAPSPKIAIRVHVVDVVQVNDTPEDNAANQKTNSGATDKLAELGKLLRAAVTRYAVSRCVIHLPKYRADVL
jgi:hypothetical protein